MPWLWPSSAQKTRKSMAVDVKVASLLSVENEAKSRHQLAPEFFHSRESPLEKNQMKLIRNVLWNEKQNRWMKRKRRRAVIRAVEMGTGIPCRIWLQGAGFHVNFEGTVTILLRNLDINLLNRGCTVISNLHWLGCLRAPSSRGPWAYDPPLTPSSRRSWLLWSLTKGKKLLRLGA